jgi:hypothetical protein
MLGLIRRVGPVARWPGRSPAAGRKACPTTNAGMIATTGRIPSGRRGAKVAEAVEQTQHEEDEGLVGVGRTRRGKSRDDSRLSRAGAPRHVGVAMTCELEN